jgi:hypothetical protein
MAPILSHAVNPIDRLRLQPSHPTPADPICGRPPPCKVLGSCFDRIACDHMSGLCVRSHMTAGQDGFRDASSKHQGGL